ncbi:MAG: hypothetical protein WB770_12300, partial [Acidimicrobiales bacterium]
MRYDDAAGALESAIRDRKADDPLAAVTVVVSSRRIGQSLRHRFARAHQANGRTGIANVRFTTLADLADEFGGTRCRSSGRSRLTRSALGAAARGALAVEPGFLAAVADQPSTEAELVALYEELRQHGDAAIELLEGRRSSGRDLARIFRVMRSRLAESFFDDADLVDAAVAAIGQQHPEEVVVGSVVVHLPERARPDECRLIAAVANECDLVVHVGLTGDAMADVVSLRIAGALKEVGLDSPPIPRMPGSGDAVNDVVHMTAERIEAPDVEAEVRAVVRVVIDHIESGGAPTRVALFYPSAKSYLGTLASVLDEAQIAWSGRSPRRVVESPAARILLGAAELAEVGLERERVIAWLNSAPTIDAEGDLVPVGLFDRVTRLAGVTSGSATEWHRHLQELAERLSWRTSEAVSSGRDEETGREIAAKPRSDRDVAIELDAFIAELECYCEQARRAGTWEDLESLARGVLRRYLGWSSDKDSPRDGADALVDAALSELGGLGPIEPRADIARFAAALEGALERVSVYEGRLSYGVGVGNLFDSVGLDLDLAVILGGVEGELPPRPRSSPLLSIEDRAALGLEAATPEAASTAARHALVALAESSRRAVCTWRLRDSSDARARVRSRFFGHDDVPVAPSPVAVLKSIASGGETAIGESELVAATLLELRAVRRRLRSFHLVGSDPDLRTALRVVTSRVAHRFDRYDGRVESAASIES